MCKCESSLSFHLLHGDGPLKLGAAIARPLGLGIGIVPSYDAIAMG